jgi:hypothetical protein
MATARQTEFDPVKTATTNFMLRQLSDQLESTITSKGRVTNQLHAMHSGFDDTDKPKDVASHPIVRALDLTLNIVRVGIFEHFVEHPAYTYLMGIPGVNLNIACKIIGGIRMDGPVCGKCGSLDTKQERNVLACWSCDDLKDPAVYRANATIEPGTLVDKKKKTKCECEVEVIDTTQGKKPKKKKCDRPVTRSKFLVRCCECGHLQHDFPNFSQLKSYSGHCPGKNRREKGSDVAFNSNLRVNCFQAFDSMLKQSRFEANPKEYHPSNAYGTIYNKWRVTYAGRYGVGAMGLAKMGRMGLPKEDFVKYKSYVEHEGKSRPEYPDLRQHFMAKNKLLDVFLCHLWRTWREGMGWDVRSLYVHEKLGHFMDYDHNDFSSPALAARKHKENLRWVRGLKGTFDAKIEALEPEYPPLEDNEEHAEYDDPENETEDFDQGDSAEG